MIYCLTKAIHIHDPLTKLCTPLPLTLATLPPSLASCAQMVYRNKDGKILWHMVIGIRSYIFVAVAALSRLELTFKHCYIQMHESEDWVFAHGSQMLMVLLVITPLCCLLWFVRNHSVINPSELLVNYAVCLMTNPICPFLDP